ncbi:MAG: hypothetical protein J0652_01365 [Desulfobulbaceae bacterium]|nr:hypothetical protein [Desulfobulbaceae bacterium]
MAFRPAVSRGLAFSKVATPGICSAAIPASCFGFFDMFARKDLPRNRSRPGLHWLKFVVCRAGIAPTENLVCLEASPVFQRAHSLLSEGVVPGEGLIFWPFILLASCLPWPFCPEPELFHSNF